MSYGSGYGQHGYNNGGYGIPGAGHPRVDYAQAQRLPPSQYSNGHVPPMAQQYPAPTQYQNQHAYQQPQQYAAAPLQHPQHFRSPSMPQANGFPQTQPPHLGGHIQYSSQHPASTQPYHQSQDAPRHGQPVYFPPQTPKPQQHAQQVQQSPLMHYPAPPPLYSPSGQIAGPQAPAATSKQARTSQQMGTSVPAPVRRTSSTPGQAIQHHSSPAQRSGTITKQSPNTSQKVVPPTGLVIDSRTLMALAEEFFDEAHRLGSALSQRMDSGGLNTYQKLIAIGLGCLETCLLNLELKPRQQALVRLRFATVTFEETENLMEAEVTLAKGITLCDQHKFMDLKYNMQFLMARILFKSKPKAGLKVLDNAIADAEAYKHTPWIYAFRFLRATLSMQVGGGSATHAASQNLRSIAALADQRNDRAVFCMANLLEVIAYLSSTSSDSGENARTALAAAMSHQLDASKLPQITFLTHCLDVVCGYLHGSPLDAQNKLRALQIFVDSSKDDTTWGHSSTIRIPITPDAYSSQVVSADTRAVLDMHAAGSYALLLSFISRRDALALSNLLSGIVLFLKDSAEPHKASQFLRQTHVNLDSSKSSHKRTKPLLNVLETIKWRGSIGMYAHVYQAFCFAVRNDWSEVRNHLKHIGDARDALAGTSVPALELHVYLTGVYHQGLGNLDQALRAYTDPRLALMRSDRITLSPTDRVRHDLSILANLNTIWINQQSSRQDPARTTADLAVLEEMCASHPDAEMKTAFDLINATVLTNPPSTAINQKNHIKAALARANKSGNAQILCIIFCYMFKEYFHGVVGGQALKSAETALLYANKSGSQLWQGVAEGLRAHGLETNGFTADAQQAAERASVLAPVNYGKGS